MKKRYIDPKVRTVMISAERYVMFDPTVTNTPADDSEILSKDDYLYDDSQMPEEIGW